MFNMMAISKINIESLRIGNSAEICEILITHFVLKLGFDETEHAFI